MSETRRTIGERTLAIADSPVFEELCGLVLKTVAMVDPIRGALEPLTDRIVLALVYGSVARGTDRAASYIDLLVVADHAAMRVPCLVLSSVPTASPTRDFKTIVS